MTKTQIRQLNTRIAAHDPSWYTHDQYVIVVRDEWLPCLLTASGSAWDGDVYRAGVTVLPMFVPFGTVDSLYSLSIEGDHGDWSTRLQSEEEIAASVAANLRSRVKEAMSLIPVERFRANAAPFVTRIRCRDYQPDFRLERDLLGACCAMRDSAGAERHLHAAKQLLNEIEGLPAGHVYCSVLRSFEVALLEGEECAHQLVSHFRNEGCIRVGLASAKLAGG